MERFLRATRSSSKTANAIGAILLTLMMLLTVVDVILRYLGKPITGTFELMAYAGALVIGFAVAQTSLDGAHVNVDVLLLVLSRRKQKIMMFINRLIGLGIFILLGWALFLKGNELYTGGEVSLTLHVPYYPVAYGLSFGCLVECLVLLSGMLKVFSGGEHE